MGWWGGNVRSQSIPAQMNLTHYLSNRVMIICRRKGWRPWDGPNTPNIEAVPPPFPKLSNLNSSWIAWDFLFVSWMVRVSDFSFALLLSALMLVMVTVSKLNFWVTCNNTAVDDSTVIPPMLLWALPPRLSSSPSDSHKTSHPNEVWVWGVVHPLLTSPARHPPRQNDHDMDVEWGSFQVLQGPHSPIMN